MGDYTGSRRASEQLGPEPLTAAQTRDAFAADDAHVTCPECGAGVRPDQDWCSLCLHVLRTPEPPPEPPPAPVVAAQPIGETAVAPAPTGLTPEVEAAADALLAQLAVATRRDRLVVPSFLNTKAKVVLFVAVGMCVFSAVVLVTFSLLGAVLS